MTADIEMLSGKNVLVTGGGGFIGSHLVERLVEAGCNVRTFVRYTSRGNIGFLERSPVRADTEIVAGDIRDPDAVQKATAGTDLVFHLAALIGIPYSYVHPHETVETNVLGTLNVLLASRDHGVERLLHTSSSEVYGTAQVVPIVEDHPLHGQSPYSASKIGADQLAESFCLSYGVPVTTIRPFNTYGPRQSTRAVIPTIITQALRGQPISLGNLEPTRDFTYVTDTAEAFVAAATSTRSVGATVNLGTSREISIRDLVELIGEIVGRKLDVLADTQRLRPPNSEVDRLLSDNSRARELLGWEPTVELRDGLTRTCAWMEAELSSYAEGYAI